MVATMAVEEVAMTNGYLRTAEAAERLQVSPRTITRWIDKDYFPGAFKINPEVDNAPFLIPVSDIEEFERKRQTGEIEE